MERKITINRQDMGFSYDSVKSLISKLSIADKQKVSFNNLIMELDFDKDDVSNLGLAILWRQLYDLNSLKCKKHIKYQDSTHGFFDQRHFFDRLTGNKSSFLRSPSIPLHFETFNPIRAKESSRAEEVSKIFSDATKDFLEKTNDFHREIKIHIAEVINNAFDHSNSTKEAGSICYFDESTGFLDFCVADMGQGIKNSFIKNNLIKAEYISLQDEEVISRATNFLVSCNPTIARNPEYPYSNGGIGLFFLREFVKKHKNCYLVIISKKGYYYVDGNNREKRRNFIDTEWGGAVVSFRVDVRQNKSQAYSDLIGTHMDRLENNALSRVNIV